MNRGSANAHYIVGYKNAGKNTGRLGNYPYQQTDLQTNGLISLIKNLFLMQTIWHQKVI